MRTPTQGAIGRRCLACAAALAATLACGRIHAADAVAVIVAPVRADTVYDVADLALIFQRKKTYWPDGRRIQPVNLPPANPARVAFSGALYGVAPAALDEYWRERYFHGVRPPFVASSAEAMLRLIAEAPDAIGYVDACAVNDSVAVIGYLDGRRALTRTAPELHCDGQAR